MCASLPKELNELPSKFSEINGEIKDLKRYVDDLEIEILWQVSSIAAQLSKLKTLDALPSLLRKDPDLKNIALDIFAQAIESTSDKTKDHNVSSTCQAGTHPDEREKNT
ncbi:hypothetical protein Tco_1293296 [Tanacetum coccineum]